MPQVETTVDADLLAIAMYSGAVTVTRLPKPVYRFNARKLIHAVYTGYGKSLKHITYNSPDKKMPEHLRENIYMFSAAKTFQQTLEMSDAMVEKARVIPFNEFKKKVKEISKLYNEDWLAAEYNTAIAQAQSASSWERFVREKNTLSVLRYSTIGDACSICGPLNGMTAAVDASVWKQLMPPNHFNCRCILTQEDHEEVATTDKESVNELKAKVTEHMQPMFKSNPGISGEAFNKHHPYFQVPKKYKEFAKKNFGLDIPKQDE